MTPAERDTLKRLIDSAVRQKIGKEREKGGKPIWCSGCGGSLQTITLGCEKCRERERQRELRKIRSAEALRDGLEHGTEATYVHHRCRCGRCVGAARRARAKRRQRVA